MNDVRCKISPPWVIYVKKLEAMFDGDPQIAFNVDYSGAHPAVVLAINNGEKATAIRKLLPETVTFGNVTLTIDIDAQFANIAFPTRKALFDTAFDKNPAYAYAVCPAEDGYYYFAATYVVFKNCVVQFFADNLNDPHGLISTLYQDIAAELFTAPEFDGCYYATDIETGKLGMPLGEWP